MKNYILSTTKEFLIALSFAIAFGLFFISSFASASGQSDVYRFWSSEYRHHFYTISSVERDAVIANDPNWAYEGVAYQAFPGIAVDTTPLFRFYSPVFRGHFYTTNASERDLIIGTDSNWDYEGISYYVKSEGNPVYRFYSDLFKGHFYTTSQTEKEDIETNDPNWRYEGVAFYTDSVASVDSPVVPTQDCGVDHGQTLSSPPANQLCENGLSVRDQTGSGPWQWACADAQNNIVAICEADTTANVNSVTALCGQTPNTCNAGTTVDGEDTPTAYIWGCIGSGGYDTFAECSIGK